MFQPSVTSALTKFATWLTNYENYPTEDQYELAQTQKTFGIHFVTSFLPIILTAFVYIPFCRQLVASLGILHITNGRLSSPFSWSSLNQEQQKLAVYADPARLQLGVLYLSMSSQLHCLGDEPILPVVKRFLRKLYRTYWCRKSNVAVHRRDHSDATSRLLDGRSEESAFLSRVQKEAEAEVYNTHGDLLKLCVQFGYITLFGAAWPLVSLGFLLYNLIKLRRDRFKVIERQRLAPVRTETIWPWIDVLNFLTWLGSLSTAVITYLYRGNMEDVKLWSVLLIVLVAEQAYLVTRFLVRMALRKIGSDAVRYEEARKYASRKRYLKTYSEEAAELCQRHKLKVRFNETTDVVTALSRASSIDRTGAMTDASENNPNPLDANLHSEAPAKTLQRTGIGVLHDPERASRFWSWHQTSHETAEAGAKLIKALGQ